MTSDKFAFLKDSIKRMHEKNINVSLFIDPDIDQIDYCIKSGAKCIELHTGNYADSVDSKQQENELNRIQVAAEYASKK